MKTLLQRLWTEPALATQVPTVVFAAAAGVWEQPWLAFAAAASAAVGAVVTRQNVTPTRKQDA